MFKKRLYGLILAAVATLSTFVLWSMQLHPVSGVEFQPPDRGRPGRLVGAGTRFSEPPTVRGGLESDRAIPVVRNGEELPCPLTAIVPQNQYGFTLSEYPSFFVHVPPIPGALVEFTLSTDRNDLVYQTMFRLSDRHGTIRIAPSADANVAPLELDRNYRWQFSLMLDPEDPSQDRQVGGWIRRVQPTDEFSKDLEKSTPQQRVNLYAEAGVWYDTVAAVAELRRSDPDNPTLTQEWQELLDSVGLSKVGQKPLI